MPRASSTPRPRLLRTALPILSVALMVDGSLAAKADLPGSDSSDRRTFVERPRLAESFADGVGLVVDLPNMPSKNVIPAARRLRNLGVHHVRIAVLRDAPPYDSTVRTFLAESGTRALGITNCAPPLGPYPAAVITAQDVRSFDAAIGGKLEAFEAMNEPDARAPADPDWASDLRSCILGDEAERSDLPFVGPALVDTAGHAGVVGDLSALVDFGNVHHYFAARNPATNGWGDTDACGRYGALSWALCETRLLSGTRPIFVTETGYSSDGEVDPVTQMKYTLRALLVNANAAVVRTYLYCLVSYAGGDGFGGMGILSNDLAPKPVYTGLRSALSALADANDRGVVADSDVRPITYSVTGKPSISHTLYVRHDRSFTLVLWNGVQSYDWNVRMPISVPATSVVVTFRSAIRAASAARVDDAGNLQPVPMARSSCALALPITDNLTFMSFSVSSATTHCSTRAL